MKWQEKAVCWRSEKSGLPPNRSPLAIFVRFSFHNTVKLANSRENHCSQAKLKAAARAGIFVPLPNSIPEMGNGISIIGPSSSRR